jgi:hypothetical protein
MKNIQVIDGAVNCAYDIFAAGQDIAFIDDVYARGPTALLDKCFARIWQRRVPKPQVNGIHGTLFYELAVKKPYYPTLRDEEAVNPGGSRLR